ncbi:MAG: UDP-N-acetylmuramate dehydrogenase [Alphaproteobacteria bacterium]|nr:UDP-N-acetylmuramate dehydrogenase [Alphaproteobacteria bacterium]
MKFLNIKWNHFLRFPFSNKDNLFKLLPSVRGRLSANEPLSKKNWFGVGGAAQIYFEPADIEDLALFLRNMPPVPLTILGAGSNVLIRDGGIPGITVHLGKQFSDIVVEENKITCGAGAKLMEVSRMAEKNNLSGFEFLCGIPGSVGGAIRMNAGAYGSQISNILTELTIVTPVGDVQTLTQEELQEAFIYRKCLFPSEWIFAKAVFQGQQIADKSIISERMAQYRLKRENGQPIGVRTAGSTFKNPDGMPAWQLIDKVGMRGVHRGGAVVSEKHSNFLINKGHATAKDIEELGEEIRAKVLEKEGIRLEWEVKKLGVDK